MYPIFEVNDADIAFPTAKNIPPLEKIPGEFYNGKTKWNKLFQQWFYRGLQKHQIKFKEGVDKTKAIRAIQSIIGSWGPKHEHKEAACAYLFSEWMEDWDDNVSEVQ